MKLHDENKPGSTQNYNAVTKLTEMFVSKPLT